MPWIYLSPHPDDAALSCGGLIWEQTDAGASVSVWTICAGDPPAGPISPFAKSLQARWHAGPQAAKQRRQEDAASCQLLCAIPLHFEYPDCIYRKDAPGGSFLYTTEESLNGSLHPAEQPLVEALSQRLSTQIFPGANLVCPLAIGGHVDHRLVRQAAERLGWPLFYYADYPYAVRQPEELASLFSAGWQAVTYPITPAGMQAWYGSVAAHASQISTFWPDLTSMRSAMKSYLEMQGGIILWQPPEGP